jgi:hypothetical protein
MPEGDVRAPPVFADDSPWTPRAVAELQRLWAAGGEADAIGVALGFSAGAVRAKARRLCLPMRQWRRPDADAPKPPRAEQSSRLVHGGGGVGLIRAGFDGAPVTGGCRRIVAPDYLERIRHGATLDSVSCGKPRLPGESWCAECRPRLYIAGSGKASGDEIDRKISIENQERRDRNRRLGYES